MNDIRRNWLFTAIAPLVVLAPAMAQTSEYCAFEVVVTSSAGAPVVNTRVAELQQDGQTFAWTFTDGNGFARLCDTPVGLVDILVGAHLCGAVAVRALSPYWMKTRRVQVTYESCAGEEWFLPGRCLLTIRVYDTNRRPLAGVMFTSPKEDAKGREQTQTSDRFGRMCFVVSYEESLSGRLVKGGYLSQAFTERCERKII
jgi:hypothetical protein